LKNTNNYGFSSSSTDPLPSPQAPSLLCLFSDDFYEAEEAWGDGREELQNIFLIMIKIL
jgi:hypothetical protein